MSTFLGLLKEKEFEEICVDRFTSENFPCKYFFLSHFHSDHYKGLEDPTFAKLLLDRPEKKLYCSEITKAFVEKKFDKIPRSKICILDRAEHLQLKNRCWVKVTPLHAGHCPGSIMLLFEGFGKRILYTGDIRLTVEDLSCMKPLHDREGNILRLDSIYLDTSFAFPEYMRFPSREESVALIIQEINHTLSISPKHLVNIRSPSKTGQEYLIVELHKALGRKLFMSQQHVDYYISCVPGMEEIITTNPLESRIHFCLGSCNSCSDFASGGKVQYIRPKILNLTTNNIEEEGGVWRGERCTTIAYSSHSSLGELLDLVEYLKPTEIHPSVVPQNSSPQQIVETIELLLRVRQRDETYCKDSPPLSPVPNNASPEKLRQFYVSEGFSDPKIV